MTDSENPTPELGIQSDDDWKARVKAEDAKLDAERAQESQTGPSESGQQPAEVDAAQLPPPEFSTLVGLLSTRAMVSLGMFAHPEDSKPAVELPLARHFIDLLSVLEEKTRGNLTSSEVKLLEQSLHELRMTFLEMSRSS